LTARFSTAEILAACGAECRSPGSREVFDGISTDTRTIAPGSLFVALKGERFDAHDFVRDAFAKGAAGAVVRRGTECPPGAAPNFALF
jgi:UDP-N-acetylmuramoyl-tripeptide--D-alanyl-D-alanine ligase